MESTFWALWRDGSAAFAVFRAEDWSGAFAVQAGCWCWGAGKRSLWDLCRWVRYPRAPSISICWVSPFPSPAVQVPSSPSLSVQLPPQDNGILTHDALHQFCSKRRFTRTDSEASRLISALCSPLCSPQPISAQPVSAPAGMKPLCRLIFLSADIRSLFAPAG